MPVSPKSEAEKTRGDQPGAPFSARARKRKVADTMNSDVAGPGRLSPLPH